MGLFEFFPKPQKTNKSDIKKTQSNEDRLISDMKWTDSFRSQYDLDNDRRFGVISAQCQVESIDETNKRSHEPQVDYVNRINRLKQKYPQLVDGMYGISLEFDVISLKRNITAYKTVLKIREMAKNEGIRLTDEEHKEGRPIEEIYTELNERLRLREQTDRVSHATSPNQTDRRVASTKSQEEKLH